MSNKEIFAKLDSISPEAWKEKIIQDLKGKDYDDTLVWTSPENIKVQPYYTDQKAQSLNSYRDSAQWQITAPIHISKDANQQALKNLLGGASHIHFIGTGDTIDIEQVAKDIQLEYASMSFQNIAWTDDQIPYLEKHKNNSIHLGINPLNELHLGKSKEYDSESLLKWIEIRKKLQASWGILSIDGSIYKNSGGHIIDEIAFILAALQENLHQLQQANIPSNSIGTILIRTAIGPNFFFEIAKIKVLRHLANIIADQYEGAEIKILAESAEIYRSNLDTPTNILRLTTEGFSAILGGAEAVMIHPYDSYQGNDFSQRISRNIQHLLLEESYLDKNLDPTKGSFYVEQLIQDLKSPAWNVFLSIEKYQGYVRSFVGKAIPEFFIYRHRLSLKKAAANRKLVMLGTNQYPNILDGANPLPSLAEKEENSITLQTYRISEPFERLRIRMQNYQEVTGSTPKAFLWESGTVSMRKARAIFAFNFLATAGIPSYESENPEDWNGVINQIQEIQPQIIVLCSDNASWETFIPEALKVTPKDTIIILAGKSENDTVDFSIYEGCDVLGTLENILEVLGIE
ncbi:MAG TPA: methylmalonyl-CoA mutase family protein [Chitinophagales bacterium]|nr:methylmalonyl-CoA mutase family protein [Chitinophagales bacterium]